MNTPSDSNFTRVNITYTTLIFTLILLLLSTYSYSQVPTKKYLPLEAYSSLPDTSQVKLSPDGNTIAMIKNNNGTLFLMTFNFKTAEKNSY